MLIFPKFYPPEVAPHISDKGVLVASPPPSSQKNCQSMEVLFLPPFQVSSFQKLQALSVFCLLQNERNSQFEESTPNSSPLSHQPPHE